jgi:hypothetical protein
MIKRHDIRPRRKRSPVPGRNGADAAEIDDLADEGDQVGALNRD